jgi:hypothetical protein
MGISAQGLSEPAGLRLLPGFQVQPVRFQELPFR